MAKREPKPRCCWHVSNRRHGRRPWHLSGGMQCASRACLDWPVCRGHLQAWANENPLEVVKRRPVGTARLHFTTKWDRVQMVFKVGGWRGYTVEVIVTGVDALTLADWYDHNGDERSALVIRYRALHVTMAGDQRRPGTLRAILARIHQLTGPTKPVDSLHAVR